MDYLRTSGYQMVKILFPGRSSILFILFILSQNAKKANQVCCLFLPGGGPWAARGELSIPVTMREPRL